MIMLSGISQMGVRRRTPSVMLQRIRMLGAWSDPGGEAHLNDAEARMPGNTPLKWK